MDSEQKIEERKKWNAPFLRAFNYLLEESYASTKGELCSMMGIEPGLISRYANGVKKVSLDTMKALARVSNSELNINYMLGKSEYMLLANVPDDEIIGWRNPDLEVIKKREEEKHSQSSAAPIDSSSEFNAAISAYVQLVESRNKEIEEKNARIQALERTIQDKETIIRDRDARIADLERKLAEATTSDLAKYPFAFGTAEEKKLR